MKLLRRALHFGFLISLLGAPLLAGGLIVSQTGLKVLNGATSKNLVLEATGNAISYAQIRVFDSERAFRTGKRPTRQVKVFPSQVRILPGDQVEISLRYLAGQAPTSGKCYTLVVDEAPPPLARNTQAGSNQFNGGIAFATRHVMKVCYG